MKTCLQIKYASGEIKLEPLGHDGVALPANLDRWLDDPTVDTVEILRVSDSEWACRTTPDTREPEHADGSRGPGTSGRLRPNQNRK